MPLTETVVGLDLGTTKTSAIIAEVSDDEVQVVGVGTAQSDGVKRGVVVNMEKAIDAVRESIDQAEQMAGVKVRDAYVSIAGDSIRSLNSRGVVAVSRSKGGARDTMITIEDVNRVLERAREVALPADREILHVLPQGFTIDNESGIRDPLEISGKRLEVDVHIVTGQTTTSQNISRIVRGAGIGMRQLVLQPLASSYAVLSNDEKDIGVVMLDIGGGTTDIAVFFDGALHHTASIPLGGLNVTRDIAQMLGIPPDAAEKLKIEKGSVFPPMPDAQPFVLEPTGDFGGRTVDLVELNSVIAARMDEIFRLVLRELNRVECLNRVAGVVLTGSGALISGGARLAEEIFTRQVRVGYPRGLYGLADTVSNPGFATGVGLILFATKNPEEMDFTGRPQSKSERPRIWATLRSAFETLIT